jgi:hypothetical protein
MAAWLRSDSLPASANLPLLLVNERYLMAPPATTCDRESE